MKKGEGGEGRGGTGAPRIDPEDKLKKLSYCCGKIQVLTKTETRSIDDRRHSGTANMLTFTTLVAAAV